MSKFILLLWISLIVILNVRGEHTADNSALCQHCNSNTLTNCTEENGVENNTIVHCKNADGIYCVIVIAAENDGTEAKNMCLQQEDELVEEGNVVATEISTNSKTNQYTTIKIETVINDDKSMNGSESSRQEFIAEVAVTLNLEGRDITDSPFKKPSDMEAMTMKSENSANEEDIKAGTMPSVEQVGAPIGDPSKLPQADEAYVNEKYTEENESQTISSVAKETTDRQPKMIEDEDDSKNMMPAKNLPICFGCVSMEDIDCTSKTMKEKICKNVDETSMGCYTLRKAHSNITTRGCISDMTLEEKSFCNLNKKYCVFCYGQSCNNHLISSSGSPAFTDSGLRILVLGLIYSLL